MFLDQSKAPHRLLVRPHLLCRCLKDLLYLQPLAIRYSSQALLQDPTPDIRSSLPLLHGHRTPPPVKYQATDTRVQLHGTITATRRSPARRTEQSRWSLIRLIRPMCLLLRAKPSIRSTYPTTVLERLTSLKEAAQSCKALSIALGA